MDNRPLKLLAAVTAIAALLFGYLAFVTSREEAASQRALPLAAVAPADWPKVVVAAANLEQGKPIEANNLKLVSAQVAPVDCYSSVEQLAGLTPARPIVQGELLTRNHFATGNDLAHTLGKDERAVAIQVNDVIGVGGLLQVGDYVDVIAYVEADGRQVMRSQARVIMERLRILAVNGESSNRVVSGRTAVLAVSARDLPRLVLAANAGTLRLALHGTADVASQARLGNAAMLRELEGPITRGEGEQVIVYRGGFSSRVVQ